MPRTDNRRLLLVILPLLAASALIPERASADSPAAIVGASTAVMAVQASVGLRHLPSDLALRPAPAPAARGFISKDLLETATELVNHGIRIGKDLAGGTVYVHCKPQGFGGVLSIRYRR